VEAVSVNLVRGLARFQDLEIHVVTTDRTCKNPVRATWEGAVIHRLPWSEKKVLMHAVGYGRREVQNYINKLSPDVIHAHDFYGIMVKGMLFPRIMTIHGFIYADTLKAERGLAWFRSLLWQRFEFSSWADHPHIVSISPYVRERLRNLTTATIHDIENPISETFFDVPRNEKKGVIFCAAVMCPRKNILGLVEAFSQIVSAGVDAELRVAGSSHDTEYERSVRAYIRFKKLEDRVSLLGPIGSEKIREELSRSSIFALTSLEEGAPLAVAEAMAVGVPVVASNCCGIPYMIREGETGFLVNPKDTDDIAGKMLILLKNDMLRARMGQKAQAHAREYYHPNRVAAKTRELYLQAVEDYARFCNLDT
jgi:glycosyltransferase involved in cell wall biosynthesis